MVEVQASSWVKIQKGQMCPSVGLTVVVAVYLCTIDRRVREAE